MRESDIRPAALLREYLRLSAADAERFFSDKARFNPRPCPGCGSDAPTPAFTKNGFGFVRCRDCDTLYAASVPADDDLASFYRQSDSQKYWAEVFFPAVADARREGIFRPRVEHIRGLLTKFGGSGRRLVDVGAGSGIFLEECRAAGLGTDLLAIEPNGGLAQQCRDKGLETFEGFADEAVGSDWNGAADLVTSFEVIEHVTDPAAFLDDLAALAKPGGLILFTGLCGTGFDILVLGERSDAVSPPHHLTFLSRKGVTGLIARCGLDEVDFSTPGKLDVDIILNAFKKDNRTVPDPFLRHLLARCGDDDRAAFQDFLATRGLSSHMWAIARRPAAATG